MFKRPLYIGARLYALRLFIELPKVFYKLYFHFLGNFTLSDKKNRYSENFDLGYRYIKKKIYDEIENYLKERHRMFFSTKVKLKNYGLYEGFGCLIFFVLFSVIFFVFIYTYELNHVLNLIKIFNEKYGLIGLILFTFFLFLIFKILILYVKQLNLNRKNKRIIFNKIVQILDENYTEITYENSLSNNYDASTRGFISGKNYAIIQAKKIIADNTWEGRRNERKTQRAIKKELKKIKKATR